MANVDVAGWDKEWKAEADWQQDGVRSARFCTRPRSGLREHPRCLPRGETLQSLHVQLGPQVHVNCRTSSIKCCWLPALHERSLGNCPQEVGALLSALLIRGIWRMQQT